MDDTQGRFVTGKSMSDVLNKMAQGGKNPLEVLRQRAKDEDGVFHMGEVLEIKGSRFRVKSIDRKGMRLRLLPR